MAEVPNVPQLYSDIQYARMFLNAASREDDPERQRSLAAIGQGFAQLAQVEAIWLGSASQESQQPPESPESSAPSAPSGSPARAETSRDPGPGRDPGPARRVDLRTVDDGVLGAAPDYLSGTYRPS
jgi:hypothetical protein